METQPSALSPQPSTVRINAFLASAGLGSRRAVERLVLEGRVQVNGSIIRELSHRVDPSHDQVTCDGKPALPASLRYVMLNKPRGYACTRSDPHGGKTIYDLLPVELRHLAHAGRLDVDSEGLLLLSNDGDWIFKLTHPSNEVAKTYVVEVEGEPDRQTLEKAQLGIQSQGERLKVESVTKLERTGRVTRLKLILREGKNREIRRIFGALHHPVISLRREAVGKLKLGALKSGAWRELEKGELLAAGC